MAEKTPKLNLVPEQAQVLSEDFNLFYQPKAYQTDPTVDEFIKSVQAFNNNVVYTTAMNQTAKQKKRSEAEAIKVYNETKLGFNKAVKAGKIPKEANPYFAEKYMELEMESKANEFANKLYLDYAEKGVAENASPNAFDSFYKDQLTQFIKDNDLDTVDPLLLNNAFFNNTSSTRRQLQSTHLSTQASKLAENHKIKTKESFQIIMGSVKSGKEIGQILTQKIKDITASGLSNVSARQYLMEAITEYASNTGDPKEFRAKLTQILNNINLGTDSLFNVKGLQDEFDAIDEALENRIDDDEIKEVARSKRKREIESEEAFSYVEEFDNFAEAKTDPRFKDFSSYKQDKINSLFKNMQMGYASTNDQDAEEELDRILTEVGDVEYAYDYLIANQQSFTESKFNKLKAYVNEFKIGGKDPLLADNDYEYYKSKIQDAVDVALQSKVSQVNVFEARRFEQEMISWIAQNKDTYGSKTQLAEAFRAYANARHTIILNRIEGGFVSEYQNSSTDTKGTEPKTLTTRTGGVVPENIEDDEGVIKNKSKVKADLSKIN